MDKCENTIFNGVIRTARVLVKHSRGNEDILVDFVKMVSEWSCENEDISVVNIEDLIEEAKEIISNSDAGDCTYEDYIWTFVRKIAELDDDEKYE